MIHGTHPPFCKISVALRFFLEPPFYNSFALLFPLQASGLLVFEKRPCLLLLTSRKYGGFCFSRLFSFSTPRRFHSETSNAFYLSFHRFYGIRFLLFPLSFGFFSTGFSSQLSSSQVLLFWDPHSSFFKDLFFPAFA